MDLPFSRSSHPTLMSAEVARSLLQYRLPPELAIKVVSHGYSPWIVTRRTRELRYRSGFSRYGPSVAGLYLSTERIPIIERTVIPQRIIFQMRAADQGWATFGGDGTFEKSHRYVAGSQRRKGRFKWEEMGLCRGENGRVAWRVCNNITAQSKYQDYIVEWRRGVQIDVRDERAVGKGEGFLELLEPGFIVVLWARAEQALWVNKVAAATVDIEYELV